MICVRFGAMSQRLSQLLLGAALSGCLSASAMADAGQASQLETARADLRALSQTFRTAYQQVRPAVVLITTTSSRRALQEMLPPRHPPLGEEESRGLGSGIIVTADGYILSSHHVVAGADSIVVTLADRRTYQATVVGADSLIDIALLRIQATQLPTVRLGDSESLQIGDWVLAIGHPLGMGTTLTHGIVSALGREASIIDDDFGVESFIQTNAVINPGNSGGPLLNLEGEVIGINTAISTRTGYFMGYGLAVPINLAREAMDDIRVHGRAVRGYLGVSMSAVTQELARELGLVQERPQGVHVRVVTDSPAARSGLRDGDIILQIAGQEVNHPNQVQAIVYRLEPGETVMLSLLRGGRTLDLTVELGERESDLLAAAGRQRLSTLGLAVEQANRVTAAAIGLTQATAEQLGFAASDGMVIVVGVDPSSVAGRLGLQVNDVITDIDQERVGSVDELLRALANLELGQGAVFWLWRPGLGVDVRILPVSE
jgi:serine protease Do